MRERCPASSRPGAGASAEASHGACSGSGRRGAVTAEGPRAERSPCRAVRGLQGQGPPSPARALIPLTPRATVRPQGDRGVTVRPSFRTPRRRVLLSGSRAAAGGP